MVVEDGVDLHGVGVAEGAGRGGRRGRVAADLTSGEILGERVLEAVDGEAGVLKLLVCRRASTIREKLVGEALEVVLAELVAEGAMLLDEYLKRSSPGMSVSLATTLMC